MKKRIISLLLFVCLIALVVPTAVISANAADTYTSADGNWEYTQEAGLATITAYLGSATEITIPDAIDGYRVTAIGDKAFSGYVQLTKIVFPQMLTKIGNKAFSGCWQLTSVTLPARLETLGSRAFEECSSLSEIIIKSASMTVNYNGYSTDARPFANAGILTDGITVTFDSGCTRIPEWIFWDSNVNITKVVIANTVTEIGDEAFRGCSSLLNVTLPESLVTIGERAFADCTAFTSVTLPAKLANLGERAFEGCTALTEIIVNCVSLNDIGFSYNTYAQPFYGAGTGTDGITVTFADGCTRVPAKMFYAYAGKSYGANITKVVIADSVTEIANDAFRDCVYLQSMDCGDGVTTIGEYAFSGCEKLTAFEFSNTLMTINEGAFYNCTALKNVALPDSLITIGNYAFYNCTAFTSVTLPAKLGTLGERAFQNCTGLTEIIVKSASMNDIRCTYNTYAQPFYNAGTAAGGITVTFADGCTKVPARMFLVYGEGVAAYVTKVVMADTVTQIGSEAFSGCVYLQSAELGSGVTSIGEYAFSGCVKLTSVEFPEVLTTINQYAFNGCSVLSNVEFPETLTTIGDYAFADCTAFTSVTLPAKLSSLGQRAFQNCTKITEINIKCAALKDIYMGYGGQPFYCAGTATDGIVVTFERGCTRIPSNLFDAHDGGSYAPNITEVIVAPGVREIGRYAFSNCIYLEKITFKGRAASFLNDYVFSGVVATAYHPGWSEDAQQDYGGDITWIGYELPIIRLGGQTRFDTAIKVADEMKEQLGVDKFDSIIIASGMNFADALSGSYLATVKNAPILLTWSGDSRFDYLNDAVVDYVKENLTSGGTVYILGGTAAVPASVDTALADYDVKRLAGGNRFETNLEILKEAGVGDKEILVCTGTNFADSLSGSATGLPILLVFNESGKLYDSQKAYLSELDGNNLCVVGGENAISFKLESAISAYGKTTRLAGANRFETSVKVAEKYFENPNSAVLAYAWNYPDGLCGGALAYAIDAPLILTMNKYEAMASEYIQGQDINTGYVLGSSELISDATVRTVFALKDDVTITAK